jgi:hypothetical protein
MLPLSIIVLFTCSTSCLGGLDYVWLRATASKKDVTDREDLWGDFRYGGVYRLKYDFFLRPTSGDWGKRLYLGRTSELPGSGSAPSVDEYMANPGNWPDIQGVVDAGFRVKCVKLYSFGAPGFGRSLFLMGEILDGQFQGTTLDVSGLSRWGDAEEGPKGLLLPELDARLVEELCEE